jgi:monofunctional glycosyltransferase
VAKAVQRIIRGRSKSKQSFWSRVIRWTMVAVVAAHLLWAIALVALRFIYPPVTGIQLQRRVESIFRRTPYQDRQTTAPLARISTELQHAVIAAEDGRFYDHHGIDWKQVRKVAEESRESGEIARGASTITQQLVKNLFFTTHRNPVRKLCEYTLAPMTDYLLGKQRTLELYLNVVEWGPGVFGAEAAAQYHFNTTASRLSRDQAARLAAILPSPRRRRPARMNQYSAAIQTRMKQMGW